MMEPTAACPACGADNPTYARFCLNCGTRVGALGSPTRRLVTVLVCDLVGSTELGERLDPEALRRLYDRYHTAMRGSITRHGGEVEKFIGDAIVAVFGIPETHEDDAARASRAGLEMVESMEQLRRETGVQLEIRIGIESGEVVADVSLALEGSIGGDAFNTAARLQSVALPGSVVVGETAAALVDGWATLESIGPFELKGKATPVRASVVRSVDAHRRATRTPFVGRARELDRLTQALTDSTLDTACVLITVLGAAGVGKSRLVEEFGRSLLGRARVLVGHTPPYGEGGALAPILEILTEAAGRATSAADVSRWLGEVLADAADGPPAAARLADLLGVGGAPTAGETSWAIRRFLETLAEERPLVVVIEDLHWAEPPLMDLVNDVADRARGPIMIVCLARPDLYDARPAWGGGKRRSQTMLLEPLDPADAHGLAAQLLPDAADDIVSRATDTAEGNPLYLEQLAASLAEHPGTTLFTPSIQALLAARLDRLDREDAVMLSAAAVIGRAMALSMIAELTETTLDDVRARTATLEGRDLVHVDADGTITFAHGLIQEAAYQRLSKTERASLHERLAGLLEAVDHPADELIGIHLERAAQLRTDVGLVDDVTMALRKRAGERLARAGSRAFARMDLATSLDLLGRAASSLPRCDPARLAILPDLGVATMERGRADEAEALLKDAVSEAEEAGSEVDGLRARLQLLTRAVYRALSDEEAAAAAEDAARIIQRLEELGDEIGLAQGWTVIEYLHWLVGSASLADAACVRAVEHGLRSGRMREQIQAGGDLPIYPILGPMPTRQIDELAQRLRDHPSPSLRAAAAALAAAASGFRGDRLGFESNGAARLRVAESFGLEWAVADHTGALSMVLRELGDFAAAESVLRDGIATMERLGDIWVVSDYSWMLPLLLVDQGRPDEALRTADTLDAEALVLDRAARILRHLTRSLVAEIRGSFDAAMTEIDGAVALALDSELTMWQTTALERRARLLRSRDEPDAGVGDLQLALALHRAKQNDMGQRRVTALLA